MKVRDHHLIVFTKNPVEGEVKTRLAKRIGTVKALEIHNALAQKTAEILPKVQAHKSLYFSKKIENLPHWDTSCDTLEIQKGKDLGERMFNAFYDSYSKGYKKTIIIGTDLWDISAQDIHTAFDALDTHTFVFGPALDGGYYLIGMKMPDKDIFENISWGGDKVLEDTLKKCGDKKTFLLKEKNDIDLLEDLDSIDELKKLI